MGNYNFATKGGKNNSNQKTTTITERSSSNQRTSKEIVQAKKSIRRMPWHREPTKDVTNCDKLRGVVNIH